MGNLGNPLSGTCCCDIVYGCTDDGAMGQAWWDDTTFGAGVLTGTSYAILTGTPIYPGPYPTPPPIITPPSIPGAAFNYYAGANTDDGSCCYVSGCSDPLASNYDPLVCLDDGSCQYCVDGCMDPLASNFNPLATCDDGSCCIDGCTDSLAINYDPLATCDDGSCNYAVLGCMDPIATNFNPLATVDDGSCLYPPSCQTVDIPDPNFEDYLETHLPSYGLSPAANATGVWPATMGDGNPNNGLVCKNKLVGNMLKMNGIGASVDFTGIAEFTNLTHADLRSNSCTSIDVSQNTTLLKLDVGNNLLTSFDISNNIPLTHLYLTNNDLTSFDASNNTVLVTLEIENNQLDYLDLRNGNNTIMSWPKADNNPSLMEILVSDPAYCQANWTISLSGWNVGAQFCTAPGVGCLTVLP